ncbi:hypothetical protein OAE48_04100 [Flavobacteriales bacterium]|nr:hypothetical protein [Flavobacteriales bacterium]
MIEIDEDDPKYIEERNNRKLTADKICQILSKVKNDPSSSAKRWVWELVQNAKDVRNAYARVSVQIELTEDSLIFRHNGDPFSLKNIFSLIQQVSSKDSANEDADVTGKFGTGFIATHLLSEIIHVSGVVLHKGVHRSFDLELDRSGSKSEEMLPKIDAALNRAHQIEDDLIFPPITDYQSTRVESDMDTVFRYSLGSEERKKAAQSGIDDLINTLPLTLVNIAKIKQVEIFVNLESSSKEVYTSELIEDSEEFSKVTVKHDNGPSRNFVVYKGEELLLTAEVADFSTMELVETFGEAPNLYRDFPLIGSENFHFPFIINGLRFNPTEDRDGIPIHAVEAADAEENREIVESAFDAAKGFTTWLTENNAINRHICAFSRLPDEKWVEFSKNWYSQLQSNYREFLLDQEIVETELGVKKLDECLIPSYGVSNDTKLNFHKLVSSFLGKEKVPKESIALNWIKVTGPSDEIDSWGKQIRYGLDSLLTDVSGLGSLDSLSIKLGDQAKAIVWLNEVYSFLINNKEVEKFDEYSILPNQNGVFKLLRDATLESKTSPIPDEFLDILMCFEEDWREDLLHREVLLPGQNIEARDLSDLSKTLNGFLSETGSASYGDSSNKFLEREDSVEVLVSILRNVLASSSKDDFRCRIFKIGKDILSYTEDFHVVKNIEGFSFDKAIKLLIGFINNSIEESVNIAGLSDKLSLESGDSMLWLNAYLCCLEGKADFEKELENGNIIPNREGDFCAHDDIKGFGTVETPLDAELVKILFELDGDQNWNSFLVAEGISISFPSKTFAELGNAVDAAIRELELDELQNEGSMLPKKGFILDLLNWCRNNKQLAEKYLQYSVGKQNELWMKFTMDDDLFRVIRNEDNLALLKQIEAKGISAAEVMELVSLASDLADLGVNGLQKMINHGKELLEEKLNFEFLKKVGESVETAFREALEAEGLDVKIGHVSVGAFDLVIASKENPANELFIEMKSYRFGSRWDFKFASSQVRKAIEHKDRYIVCVLERPENDGLVDTSYIKSNVKGCFRLHQFVSPVLNQIATYEELRKSNSGVRLVLDELGAARIHVPYEMILTQAHAFFVVVDSIKMKLFHPEVP